jgi:hypothetical protein
MKNRLSDLRNHLFETIEGLKDNSMPVDRARAISDAAGKIIDSGKMELEFVKFVGDREASKFFDTPAQHDAATIRVVVSRSHCHFYRMAIEPSSTQKGKCAGAGARPWSSALDTIHGYHHCIGSSPRICL